jgi:hypothetical protein
MQPWLPLLKFVFEFAFLGEDHNKHSYAQKQEKYLSYQIIPAPYIIQKL